MDDDEEAFVRVHFKNQSNAVSLSNPTSGSDNAGLNTFLVGNYKISGVNSTICATHTDLTSSSKNGHEVHPPQGKMNIHCLHAIFLSNEFNDTEDESNAISAANGDKTLVNTTGKH